MGQIIWIVVTSMLIANLGYAGELPTLDELKESAVKNNIEIICKRQEIGVYKLSNSILSNIEGVSSYNFETDTKFYGVKLSLPLPFYFSYKSGLRLKEKELERIKQEVISRLEGLYSEYLNLCEKLQVAEIESMNKKSRWNTISICKEVIESEKVYRETQLRLTEAQRKFENLKVKLEFATATVREREVKLKNIEKLYSYNRVEKDEVIKAKEELEAKKGFLLDLQMQEANLIDELELLKMDVECKEAFCQVARDQTLSQSEKDYKMADYECNRLRREVEKVEGELIRMSGYQGKGTHP